MSEGWLVTMGGRQKRKAQDTEIEQMVDARHVDVPTFLIVRPGPTVFHTTLNLKQLLDRRWKGQRGKLASHAGPTPRRF